MRSDRRGRESAASPEDWFVVGLAARGSPISVMDAARFAAAGVSGIRADDGAFDSDQFTAWAESVYLRAVAAWRDQHPELLRPVMTQQVWESYAQYLLTVSRVALGRQLMASAEAAASIQGAISDERCQSVLVGFEVRIAAGRARLIGERAQHWHERWLFQRPPGSHTHASGAVAVCLVCGGPADPADSGRCPYCHSDITTRTASWLVTQVATTMSGSARLQQMTQPQVHGAPQQPPRS